LLGFTISLPIQNRQPKTVALLIQKSAARTVPLQIHKSKANCAAVESKIDSKKLWRCRFKNRQPKTTSLPISESAAKNCVVADSKIDNDGGVISVLLLSFFLGVYKTPLATSPTLSRPNSVVF
jgi:hypothetical protein